MIFQASYEMLLTWIRLSVYRSILLIVLCTILLKFDLARNLRNFILKSLFWIGRYFSAFAKANPSYESTKPWIKLCEYWICVIITFFCIHMLKYVYLSIYSWFLTSKRCGGTLGRHFLKHGLIGHKHGHITRASQSRRGLQTCWT